jgi:glycine/serine hydroxymethyltransferase
MELFYRRPSNETRTAMSNAALNLKHVSRDKYEETALAEEAVKNLTKHEHVKIVNSGNSAILSVMSTLTKDVMIPDQGGWSGFKKMARIFGLETIKLPTNLGLIEPEVLEESIKKFSPEVIFITSFGGYVVEQPTADIYKICEENGVLLVEDASGGIGDPLKKLGNGANAHVIVASTGSPKTVNVGNGGFLSTNSTDLLDAAQDILKTVKADPVTCAGIASEIKNAPITIEKTIKACEILKSEINEFRDVLHHNKRGLNIVLPEKDNKSFAYSLRKKFNVHGGGIVTLCPNNNRVKLKAVCIEIKNLDIGCLSSENMEYIVNLIKN